MKDYIERTIQKAAVHFGAGCGNSDGCFASQRGGQQLAEERHSVVSGFFCTDHSICHGAANGQYHH